MRHIPDTLARQMRREVILLIGMHRSGTSLLGSLVEGLGISVGDTLHPADPHDPACCFEDGTCVDIQERMLQALGQPWAGERGMLPFPAQWWRAPEMASLVEELANWIDHRLETDGVTWAFKDSHITRFLPLWRELLGKRGLIPRCILAARDPAEVVASEATRDGIPADRVLLIWLRYNLDALLHAGADLAGVFIYGNWWSEGAAQLQRLATLLRVSTDEVRSIEHIGGGIIRDDLYRQRGGSPVPRWATKLYVGLQELAREIAPRRVAEFIAEAEYFDALVRLGKEPRIDGPLVAVISEEPWLRESLQLARQLGRSARVILSTDVSKPLSAPTGDIAVVHRAADDPTVAGTDRARATYLAWRWSQRRAFTELHVQGGDGLAAHILDARRQGLSDHNGGVFVHYFDRPGWLDDDGRFAPRCVEDIESASLERRVFRDALAILRAPVALQAALQSILISGAKDHLSEQQSLSEITPLVSICVTHFNRPALLHDCLESVRTQSYQNIEVVLVDDGSNIPAAAAFLDKLDEEFASRGWIIVRQENQYLGAARNTAVRAAKGKYLFFLDDDNLLRPDAIALATRLAEQTGADIVTSIMSLFRGPPGTFPVHAEEEWVFLGDDPLRGIFDNSFGDAAALVRRDLHDRLGGFTEDRGVGAEDWEFFLKAALSGARIEHSLTPFCWYRVEPKGMARSGSWWRDYRRALRPCEAALPSLLRDLPVLTGALRRRVGLLNQQLKTEISDRQLARRKSEEAAQKVREAREAQSRAEAMLAEAQVTAISLQAEAAQSSARINELRQRVADVETEAAIQREAATRAAIQLNAIEASTFWRMTSPARNTLSHHPRLARWGRRFLKAAFWTVTGQLPARLQARNGASAEPAVDLTTEAPEKSRFRVIPHYIDPADTWRDPPAFSRSRIAVHLHVFYFHLLEGLLIRLRNIPFPFDVFVSLPDFASAAQADQVERMLRDELSRAGRILVKPVPNRGRDIAPFIITFGDTLLGYDIIGHFHTKSSPHNPELAGWRDMIFDLLFGPAGNPGGHVACIVGLLEESAKIVYPEGPASIPREPTGWAGNHAIASHILAKHTGLSIADFPSIEFSEGSMMWARSAALKDFLQLPLSYDDFPPEPIGADGTLAHALERISFVLAHRVEGDFIRLHKGDSIPDYRSFEEAQDFSGQIAHTDVKVLTYYLPQFHPIPENDAWHGAGFTEWTKVRAANPLFRGHYQQHIPHPNVGYYLLDHNVLRRQASDMKGAGIYGQIFYHYWFGGKLILERPAKMLLENVDIKIPFCFCWANENWTRQWDGGEDDILLEQDYSAEDARAFIRYLIPFFKDVRYIKLEGRPVLFVYRPTSIPMVASYLAIWREECELAKLERPYVVATLAAGAADPREFGMDAGVERVLYDWTNGEVPSISTQVDAYASFGGHVFSYESIAEHYAAKPIETEFTCFRSLVPNWDNTARYGGKAHVVHGSTPRLFQGWLEVLIAQTRRRLPPDRRFIVVNAWNEWAEGAHMEADSRYGYAYLNAVGRALANEPARDPAPDSYHGLAIARAAEQARSAGAMLMVTHRWGGGTERHVRDMIKALTRDGIIVFLMRVAMDRPNWVVIERAGAGKGPELAAFAIETSPNDCARLLGRLHVRHVHVQHLAGFPAATAAWIQDICTTAGIRYDVTLHDYMAVCPRIVMTNASNTYCGEPPLSQCESCIATIGSHFGRPSVAEWRGRYGRLLAGARRRFVPSDDAAERLARYFSKLDFTVRQHLEPRHNPARLQALQSESSPRATVGLETSPGRKLHVAVIGQVDGHKGFDILLEVSRLAQKVRAPIRFTIIGVTSSDLEFTDLANVSILGPYNSSELLEIVDRESPDFAFLPSCCPETYSFTLTETVAAGAYPVVFDLGAMGKRVRSLGWGMVLPAALMNNPEALLRSLLEITPTPPPPAAFEMAGGTRYASIMCDYYGLDWSAGIDSLALDRRVQCAVSRARLRTANFVPPGREAALLVTHAAGGHLKPHVQRYVSALSGIGIDVYLIVAVDLWSQTPHLDMLRDTAGVFIRDNEGYDFAAWAHVLLEFPEFKAVDILYLVNDSVIGPVNHDHFSSAIARIRDGAADVYGMTENYEQGWHLQSYFLAIKRSALRSRVVEEFFDAVVSLESKQAVIENYEISFASKAIHAGFKAEALFTLVSERNMTIYHWKELIRRGFPFVKVQVARDEIPGVDRKAVRRFLEIAGYSPDELRGCLEMTK